MDLDKICKTLISLVHIMEKLRGPNGCPWDAKQTDNTIKIYLLEEAYEVLDAIDKHDPKSICEELGDLFFQIIFLSHMADERNEFCLLDVFERIREKMIRRHPHVFGNKKIKDANEVVENWTAIKMKEKNASYNDILNEIPSALPALLRSHRLSERAARVGFDWRNKEEIWKKVKEEFYELSEAIKKGDKKEVEEEIGDILFSLVNLARHWGLNAENILRMTNNKFIERFKKMENELKKDGIDIKDATLEQMDMVWEKIKKDV